MNRSLFSVLKSSDGFTLLEILVSVVFISIGFLGLASTVTTVMKGNELSGEQTEAVIMAQEKLEELRNKDFNMGADFAIRGETNNPIEANDLQIVGKKGAGFLDAFEEASFTMPMATEFNAVGGFQYSLNWKFLQESK